MRCFLLLIAFLIPGPVFSQDAYPGKSGSKPEAGKPMPYFKLNNITHFKKAVAILDDFAGQWLFIDFWFPGCVSCIKSFSRINTLQEIFNQKVQFVLVGLNNKQYEGSQAIYEKLRIKQRLNLTVAYDSVLISQWEIWSMPHIIIVDPGGIVHSITTGQDITADKIYELIDGKKVSFVRKDVEEKEFNPENFSEVRLSSDGKGELVYRSLLTPWNGERSANAVSISRYLQYIDSASFQVAKVPLYELYNYAYTGKLSWTSSPEDPLYGKMFPVPVIELKDPGLFRYDYIDKGYFNYNITIPGAALTPERVMKIMRGELANIFEYDVSVENRRMPVWRLVRFSEKIVKLKTNGGPGLFKETGNGATGGVVGFTMKNYPVQRILEALRRFAEYDNLPYLDETGIQGNIDITIDALMTDFNEVRKALQKNGLDLVKGEKEMSAIVIRDPKHGNK